MFCLSMKVLQNYMQIISKTTGNDINVFVLIILNASY